MPVTALFPEQAALIDLNIIIKSASPHEEWSRQKAATSPSHLVFVSPSHAADFHKTVVTNSH